jgi:hypothetical protein
MAPLASTTLAKPPIAWYPKASDMKASASFIDNMRSLLLQWSLVFGLWSEFLFRFWCVLPVAVVGRCKVHRANL